MSVTQKWCARHEALAYGTLGLCFCLCIALAPDLLSALGGHDGYVWTPFNSYPIQRNDSFYYSAWVVQGIQSGFPSGSPSAAEYVNKALVETIRWFPLAVAALPSLLFSDFRLVYVLDYVFTVFWLFGIPFYLTYRFTKSSLGSLMIGVLVLFYSGLSWNIFYIFRIFLNLSDHGELPSFRYINLSTTGPILMVYIALCHLFYAKTQRSYIIVGTLLLLSPCMAFSYPSHTVIAYATLVGYAALTLLKGHKRETVTLLMIGVLTASILLLSGYIDYVRQTLAINQLWTNVFNNEKFILIDKPYWTLIRMAFINKYTVSLSLALWLTWKNRELRDMVVLLGSIGFSCNLTSLLDMPLFSVRFLVRGIDQPWLTALAIACLWGWKERIKLWISSRAIRHTAAKFLEIAIFLLILALPTLGIGASVLKSAKYLTRFMPQEQWEALKWVDRNVPNNDTIAALNWDDITLVPIYTHANLVVDVMIIGGRSPEDELKRYTALWKILGFPREKLGLRIAKMVEVASQWQNLPTEAVHKARLLDPESYAAGQIAALALYWPSVRKIWGIDIADGDKTSRPLIDRVMMLYDAIDPRSAVKEYQISMVLLSGIELTLPLKTEISLEQVFKNKTHTIYRVLN